MREIIEQILQIIADNKCEVPVSVLDHLSDKSNPHEVTKSQLGLANVNNTKDIDKPVSTAQQTAINTAKKEVSDLLVSHAENTTNPHNVTKSQIGLGNVNNTSDANKPVSTAQQAALDNLYQQLTAYTQQKIAELINGAPETMDTIKEVHDAIVAHQTIIDALNAAIGKKASAAEFDSHVKDTDSHFSASERTKLAGIAAGANNYSHPTTAGNKHIPTGGSAGKILRWSASGTAVWGDDVDTTYDIVSKTAAGLTPQLPNETTTTKYLRQDGTWAVPPDTNTTYTAASAAPKAAGTAAVGTSAKYAREDHVHPLQTTVSGNAGTATKLATARTIQTNLGSTGTASFDGSANVAPGVTGTLPIGNGGTGATTAAGALDALLSGSATKAFTTSKTAGTYLAGNQGNAIINSSAAAGAYTMLAKMNSTNGYFTHGVYQNKYLVQYTAKSTVDAATNSVTKALTLLDESGNTVFPGTVTASAFSGNASSASKLGTNAGSATQPVYFSGGVPVACTNTLGKSVPSDAKFTDTTYSAMTAATASAAGKSGLVPAPAAGKQTSFLRGDGTWVVPTNTTYSNFVKSGAGAAAGLVPSPGTVAGNVKYLCENGTWSIPVSSPVVTTMISLIFGTRNNDISTSATCVRYGNNVNLIITFSSGRIGINTGDIIIGTLSTNLRPLVDIFGPVYIEEGDIVGDWEIRSNGEFHIFINIQALATYRICATYICN